MINLETIISTENETDTEINGDRLKNKSIINENVKEKLVDFKNQLKGELNQLKNKKIPDNQQVNKSGKNKRDTDLEEIFSEIEMLLNLISELKELNEQLYFKEIDQIDPQNLKLEGELESVKQKLDNLIKLTLEFERTGEKIIDSINSDEIAFALNNLKGKEEIFSKEILKEFKVIGEKLEKIKKQLLKLKEVTVEFGEDNKLGNDDVAEELIKEQKNVKSDLVKIEKQLNSVKENLTIFSNGNEKMAQNKPEQFLSGMVKTESSEDLSKFRELNKIDGELTESERKIEELSANTEQIEKKQLKKIIQLLQILGNSEADNLKELTGDRIIEILNRGDDSSSIKREINLGFENLVSDEKQLSTKNVFKLIQEGEIKNNIEKALNMFFENSFEQINTLQELNPEQLLAVKELIGDTFSQFEENISLILEQFAELDIDNLEDRWKNLKANINLMTDFEGKGELEKNEVNNKLTGFFSANRINFNEKIPGDQLITNTINTGKQLENINIKKNQDLEISLFEQKPIFSSLTNNIFENISLEDLQIIDQISEQINDQIQDISVNQEVSIRLEPEVLGNIELDIKIDNNQITARLEVENSAVENYLEENISVLRDNLNEIGFEINDIEVEKNDNYSGDREQNNSDFRGQNQDQSQNHNGDNNHFNDQNYLSMYYEYDQKLSLREGFTGNNNINQLLLPGNYNYSRGINLLV